MKKYKVGYVQGSFDMFHIGHLNLIKNAKSICDYLIVGVNSDELMKSFKHKTPIIPEDERLEIIEAIRYVDEAHIVTNRDKLEALDKFHYQALIMGDDWKGTDFYKKVEQQLKEKNAEVVYFPYTKTTSSTLLRDAICERVNGK